jgi:hypothetical protein
MGAESKRCVAGGCDKRSAVEHMLAGMSSGGMDHMAPCAKNRDQRAAYLTAIRL